MDSKETYSASPNHEVCNKSVIDTFICRPRHWYIEAMLLPNIMIKKQQPKFLAQQINLARRQYYLQPYL